MTTDLAVSETETVQAIRTCCCGDYHRTHGQANRNDLERTLFLHPIIEIQKKSDERVGTTRSSESVL